MHKYVRGYTFFLETGLACFHDAVHTMVHAGGLSALTQNAEGQQENNKRGSQGVPSTESEGGTETV